MLRIPGMLPFTRLLTGEPEAVDLNQTFRPRQ